MDAIEYHRPATQDEALELAHELGEEVAFLAGGQSLVDQIKQRAVSSDLQVIDIGGFDELSHVTAEEEISIGSLSTHRKLAHSDLLQSKLPVLAETAAQVADVQVRNMGTVGGNVVRADPAADYPLLLEVLDAQFEVISATDERTIRAEDFFVDRFESALENDELLTEILVPSTDENTVVEFQKLASRAGGGVRTEGRGDFALVNAAVSVTVETNSVVGARVGVGAVQNTPIRASSAETDLIGSAVGNIHSEEIGKKAAAEINPEDHDRRVSTSYKKSLIRTLVKRAVTNAIIKLKSE